MIWTTVSAQVYAIVFINKQKIDITWGSGGGSVGRVVASTSRAPQLESNHWQNFIMNIFTTNC